MPIHGNEVNVGRSTSSRFDWACRCLLAEAVLPTSLCPWSFLGRGIPLYSKSGILPLPIVLWGFPRSVPLVADITLIYLATREIMNRQQREHETKQQTNYSIRHERRKGGV